MSKSSRKALRYNAFVLATATAFGISWAANVSAQAARGTPHVQYDTVDNSQSYSRLIVKYRETGAARAAAMSAVYASIDAVANGSRRNLRHLRTLATGAELVEVQGARMSADQTRALMAEFGRQAGVEYVEPDAQMYALYTPNDTRYNEQWHYFDSVAGMNLPAAWDIATGTGVVVAVIDTGITPHSDLSANLVAGYDFVSDSAAARDGNGRDSNPNDEGDWWTNAECGPPPVPASQNSSWHGSHVTGTIAAISNNSTGVAGVAFGAKVQPVRVLAKCGGSLSDIADAIVWASGGTVTGVPANPTPAKVINMSLGGGGACGTTYQTAITGAVGRGTVVVVAAGNDNADAINYRPSSCNNVVNVAAIDKEGNRSYYSNYGTSIDVAAPGGEVNVTASKGVLSTLNTGTTTQGSATYSFYQGTSMAAPHVAGLAALILSKASKTPAEIETLLKNNTRPLAGTCTGGCGTGLVDALKTLQAVTGGGGGGTVLQNGVPVTGLGAATGAQLAYTIVVPAGASNLNIVTSGGSGDADLYVKFGSAPTLSVYDCRPFAGGNAETCTFATPQAGTYHIMLNGYAAFSGVTLTGSYGTGAQQSFFENQADYAINDNATVDSPISVVRTGNAPSTLSLSVTIYHTYQGDLKVDLVAPDGSLYNIHNYTGAGTDNIIKTVTVNASSEVAQGTWKLRVNDNAAGDVGRIDKWSMQF